MLKKILKITLIVSLGICLSRYGSDVSLAAGSGMMTGDAEFDTILGDINVHTQGEDLSDFVSNLSVSYRIPEIEIENMLFTLKMSPADAYMAVGLANISNRPLNYVVEEYQKNKGRGWGVIAKNLGIKPGSKEFHALKNGGSEQLGKVKKKGAGVKDKEKKPDNSKGKPYKGKNKGK
ncbi:MAG: hypothetical protein JW882_12890 [Deltaproteobacteria bacterium]|nr:hypothetical protein [Deltaproteobacteria bacterium]